MFDASTVVFYADAKPLQLMCTGEWQIALLRNCLKHRQISS
jgi:hypothetical protein